MKDASIEEKSAFDGVTDIEIWKSFSRLLVAFRRRCQLAAGHKWLREKWSGSRKRAEPASTVARAGGSGDGGNICAADPAGSTVADPLARS